MMKINIITMSSLTRASDLQSDFSEIHLPLQVWVKSRHLASYHRDAVVGSI
jgi:hypothetical protein